MAIYRCYYEYNGKELVVFETTDMERAMAWYKAQTDREAIHGFNREVVRIH